MEMETRKVVLSAILALIAAVLSMAAPGMILASLVPPLPLVIVLVSLPLVFIPFAIGWLTPPAWWLGGIGAFGLVLLAVIITLSDSELSLGGILARLPFLLPLLLTLSFAYLGRTLRQRSLQKRIP